MRLYQILLVEEGVSSDLGNNHLRLLENNQQKLKRTISRLISYQICTKLTQAKKT
jgi:hypothetical protein